MACLASLFLSLEWGAVELPWSGSKVPIGLPTWIRIACDLVFHLASSEKGKLLFALPTVQTFVLTRTSSSHESSDIEAAHRGGQLHRLKTIGSCYDSALISLTDVLPRHQRNSSCSFQPLGPTITTIVGAISAICAGFWMTTYRHYAPLLLIDSLIYISGSVVYSSLGVASGPPKYVGCQVLAGIGFEISVRITLIAVQAVTPSEDMPTSCASEVFSQVSRRRSWYNIAQLIITGVPKTQLQPIICLGCGLERWKWKYLSR